MRAALHRLRALVRDELGAGIAGAATVAALELAALHSPRPGVIGVVLALFALVGLAIGGLIALVEAIVRRWRLAGWRAALVRAAPVAISLLPVARTLFDGAYASTLPGAAWAIAWVPLAG
jgi:hypothetical protein